MTDQIEVLDEAPAAADLATEASVRVYLESHPDFLIRHPDLLDKLAPPDRNFGDGVVDMQRFQFERLKSDLVRLRRRQREMVEATSSNMSTLRQVHAVVLALIEIERLPQLAAFIAGDLPRLLEVDAAGLLIEADDVPADWIGAGLRPLPPGAIARWFGNAERVLLRPYARDKDLLYGDRADRIGSDALVQIPVGAPGSAGPLLLMAVGSAPAGHFDPAQGTEILLFLAEALSRVVRRCLAR